MPGHEDEDEALTGRFANTSAANSAAHCNSHEDALVRILDREVATDLVID